MADQRGTASILVVFMLLVLVTLGALAITSANANYKLSQRSLSWNAMYYELDAYGEEFLADLDNKLTDAESMTLEYIENKKYLSAQEQALPAPLQEAIFSTYNQGGLAAVSSKLYMYYADIYLNELTLSYPGLQLYTVDSELFIDTILVELTLTSEREPANKLSISIWVEPVEDGGLRYVIEDWYEYQEVEMEEKAPELWDGSID